MEERKLRRSKDRMLAGVCGGIADYMGIDVTIVRLIFVLLTFMASGGIWVYIILWIVMPEDVAATPPPTTPPTTPPAA